MGAGFYLTTNFIVNPDVSSMSCKRLCKVLFYNIDCVVCIVEFKIRNKIGSLMEIVLDYDLHGLVY